ncbi:hypothetical protein BD560DRAFT_416117 [Blakeslea trispora]|nr:hypothetical protein BD560DRAFT_416117 [Blakeslea trispora]
MTAYTLLEQPSRRTLPKRQWQIIIVAVSALLIVLFLASFLRGQEQSTKPSDSKHTSKSHGNINKTSTNTTITTATNNDSLEKPIVPSHTTPLNTTVPPLRSIAFSLPQSNTTHYIDLDKYPIEDQLVQLFGSAMVFPALQKVLQKGPSTSLPDWLDNNQNHCAQYPLPYPLLRQITKDYLPLEDQDAFFHVPINLTHPFILFPHPSTFKPGQSVCIRVVVPFKDKGKDDPYRLMYRPYDQNHAQLTSPWWDTMMTSLINHDNSTTPIHMQPWTGHRLLRERARQLNHADMQLPEWARLRADLVYERERLHVYEATVSLQPGQWTLEGLLEFVEGRYNFEFGPVTPYQPSALPVFPAGSERFQVTDRRPLLLSDRDAWMAHMRLPLCQGMDHPGRWLPLPQNLTQSERARTVGTLRNNKYWAPFDCRYRHLSYEAFNRCLSKRYTEGMDLYGDSNIRRSIKKFLSHGQWCKDWDQHITQPLLPDELKPVIQPAAKRAPPPPPPPPVGNDLFPPSPVEDPGVYHSPEDYKFSTDAQTRSCYCEDYTEIYWNPVWFDAGARRFDMVYRNSRQQSEALGKTEWDTKESATDQVRVSSYKWDGLTYLNSPGWDTAVPSSSGTANIAIFSLGNWDGAFSQLGQFAQDVDRLIQQIQQHYRLDQTKIVYRTAQYYCCRIDASERSRQVSGPRMESFDQIARYKFTTQLNATVWDTSVLGESKLFEEKLPSITCPSNHVPADQVEIENQILMNGLCN